MNELAIRVKERFNEFIAQSGLSVAAFEKKCGLSNGYVRNFKGNFGIAKLEDILSAFPLLNKEWLLYGNGNMLLDSESQPQNPTVEQPEDRGMIEKMLLLVESQRKDIETLIELVKKKDEKIAELVQENMELNNEISRLKLDSLMHKHKGGIATNAGDSSSASAG